METSPGQDIRICVIEEPTGDRAERLKQLLAVGIDRWLRGKAAVDSGRDVSVYPDMGPGRPRW